MSKSKHIIIPGQRFERWVVICPGIANRPKDKAWLCECDCGTRKVVTQTSLLRTDGKNSKSCGCLQREAVSQALTKHGMSNSDEYRTWRNIISRTTNPNATQYDEYRKIGVADIFKNSFEAFYKEVGPKPSPEYSIERINNNKSYEPGNIKWGTRIEQNNNSRRNIVITFRGKTQTLAQWTQELGLPYEKIRERIKKLNWSVEKAFTTPV
jgi:hypothetical protein